MKAHTTVHVISEISTRSFIELKSCLYKLSSCLIFLVIFHASSLNADQPTPQRIITLSPHLAELVFLLGAGDQLSGVSERTDYPPSAKNITRIGGASGLDMEQVVSINPDLVLAWQGGTRESDINALRELGIRVVRIQSSSLEEIPGSLKTLGELLSKQQQAAVLITRFNEELMRISEKYMAMPRHRVFVEISSQPLMGLTNLHPFGAGLEICGLDNIFSDIDKAALTTDLESILSRDVDYVLLRQASTTEEFETRKAHYRLSDDAVR